MFHYWIHAVCRARGLPDGCCNLIEGIYHFCACLVRLDGAFHFIMWVLCGVIQGDPFSGSLYAIGFDPFVEALAKLEKDKLSGID